MERALGVRNLLTVGAALLSLLIVVAIAINDPLAATARLIWHAQPWHYAYRLTILAWRGLVAVPCSLLSLAQMIAWIFTSLGIDRHALRMAAVVLVAQAVCCLHQSYDVVEHKQDIPVHKGKKRWGHKRRIHWYRTHTVEFPLTPSSCKQFYLALLHNIFDNYFIWLPVAFGPARRSLVPLISSFLSLPHALPPLGVMLLCLLAALAGLIAWDSRHRTLAWQQFYRKDTRLLSMCAISVAAALLCLVLPSSLSSGLHSYVPMAQGLAVTSTVTPLVQYGMPDVDAKVQEAYAERYLQRDANSGNFTAGKIHMQTFVHDSTLQQPVSCVLYQHKH
jgi:hypothetical protein